MKPVLSHFTAPSLSAFRGGEGGERGEGGRGRRRRKKKKIANTMMFSLPHLGKGKEEGKGRGRIRPTFTIIYFLFLEGRRKRGEGGKKRGGNS